jgi:hypothetical protein
MWDLAYLNETEPHTTHMFGNVWYTTSMVVTASGIAQFVELVVLHSELNC